MPAPIYYAHKILRPIRKPVTPARRRCSGPDSKSQVTVQYENGKPVGVTRDRGLDPASGRGHDIGGCARVSSPMCARRCRRLDQRQDHLAHQSDRTLRHRRSRRRYRFDRAQDHRRHLWRRGPAWRRRVLRQGSDQGRSFGGLCRALSRQEHRRRRSRRSLHAALAYAIGVARPLSIYIDTHGTGKVSEDKLEKAVAEAMDLTPARHSQASRSQQADLRTNLVLWPFRPHAGR